MKFPQDAGIKQTKLVVGSMHIGKKLPPKAPAPDSKLKKFSSYPKPKVKPRKESRNDHAVLSTLANEGQAEPRSSNRAHSPKVEFKSFLPLSDHVIGNQIQMLVRDFTTGEEKIVNYNLDEKITQADFNTRVLLSEANADYFSQVELSKFAQQNGVSHTLSPGLPSSNPIPIQDAQW